MHVAFASKDVPIFEAGWRMSSIFLSVFGDGFAEVFGPALFILLPSATSVFYQAGYWMCVSWLVVCVFHLRQDSGLACSVLRTSISLKKKKKKNYNNDNNNKREAKVNWIITVAVKGNLQDTGVDVRREAVYRCDDATEDQEP